MAYYDAMIAKWATLNPGTTAAKLSRAQCGDRDRRGDPDGYPDIQDLQPDRPDRI
jgi:hypothetical protein